MISKINAAEYLYSATNWVFGFAYCGAGLRITTSTSKGLTFVEIKLTWIKINLTFLLNAIENTTDLVKTIKSSTCGFNGIRRIIKMQVLNYFFKPIFTYYSHNISISKPKIIRRAVQSNHTHNQTIFTAIYKLSIQGARAHNRKIICKTSREFTSIFCV